MIGGTKSGFEAFRVVIRDMDPVTEGTMISLKVEIALMHKTQCANLAATRQLSIAVEKISHRYRETTWAELENETKVMILHTSMDTDTLREIRRGKTVNEFGYIAARDFIEALHHFEQVGGHGVVPQPG